MSRKMHDSTKHREIPMESIVRFERNENSIYWKRIFRQLLSLQDGNTYSCFAHCHPLLNRQDILILIVHCFHIVSSPIIGKS